MRVLFCRSNKIGAWIIRWLTWSRWSHCGIVVGDHVIEAAWPRVRMAPLHEVLAAHPRYVIVDFPLDDPWSAIEAAKAQIGKPYDLLALFGFLFRRNWQKEDSWFCSELVAWALTQGGRPLFRPEALRRVSPEHLWMVEPGECADGTPHTLPAPHELPHGV